MEEKKESLFRKKVLDRISSPDQLTDYLRVTNPGIWVVLAAVIILLAGLFVWSAVGSLETTAKAKVIVENHEATVVLMDTNSGTIKAGQPLRIASIEFVIASVEKDEYGRNVGIAEVTMPDGTYGGTVVVDSTRPIEFLLESK